MMKHLEASRAEAVCQLIERFKPFASAKTKEAELRADRLKASVKSFWSGFAKAATASALRERSEAPRFNMIRLLELHRLEKNHSKLLADFLDPKGTHSQGTVFLECFLDRIGCGHLKAKLAGRRVEAKTELWVTEKSRLDIIIRCFPEFILVIENKIQSGEGASIEGGATQLQKYWDWLKQQQLRSDGKRILVFLTIHPERASVEEAFCMTYLQDVRRWLVDSLERVRAPRVREAVCQYLETIEDLRHLRGESYDPN
jgi:PD-(D/E)XK nuclease superfamily